MEIKTVRDLIVAIMNYREVTINGWIVREDRGMYYALDKHGHVKFTGNAAEVYTFVHQK